MMVVMVHAVVLSVEFFMTTHEHGYIGVMDKVVTDAPQECPPDLTHASGPNYNQIGVFYSGRLNNGFSHFSSHLFHLSSELR